MAEVILSPTLAIQRWRSKYFAEYVRESRFMPYMGKRPNDVIQVADDLEGKPGNVVHMPMVFRIQGGGVSGSQPLIGQEAEMPQGDALIQTDWLRNGVVIPKSTSFKSDIDLMDAGKTLLRGWFSEMLRDSLIREIGAVIVPGTQSFDLTGAPIVQPDVTVPFNVSSTAQQNTYLTNNFDRILFGSKRANTVAGNFAASLANITQANDRASAAMLAQAKRLFKQAGGTVLNTAPGAGPHMRPYKAPNGGQEYVVVFADSNSFRDIATDATIVSANQLARPREGTGFDKNPLFQDGDLMYRGIIVVEMPELDYLTINNAANGNGNVGVMFMCGAQAVGLAYTQMIQAHPDTKYDYDFRPRVGFDECRGQKKFSYGGKSLGVLPIYTYSLADA